MDEWEKPLHWLEERFSELAPLIYEVNRTLWSYAEPSGEEVRSAALLCRILEGFDFTVRKEICGRPTAFIAQYGSGGPVVAFLGEYDALPGLSQTAGRPEPAPVEGQTCGHGCGHCALGSGSLAAALLVRRYLEEHRLPGTVRYYGCCDEEVDGVKPLMAREGAFDDVDCVFAWHPGGETGVPNTELAAMQSLEVTFRRDPEGGGRDRTLDACGLMNVAVNYLREHLSPQVRLHYAYLDADDPAKRLARESASMAYVIRAPRRSEVLAVWKRVEDCARGAALMTGTQVHIGEKTGYADRFQNHVVARILSDAALAAGPPAWDSGDYALAGAFVAQYSPQQRDTFLDLSARKYPGWRAEERLAHPLDPGVEPFDPAVCVRSGASSDVGDVGYAAPTASMRVACTALGTPAHSWFLTGMVASSIGEKGIACAARILSLAAVRVFRDPGLLNGAQEERKQKIGGLRSGRPLEPKEVSPWRMER